MQAYFPVLALSVAAEAFGFREASGLNLLAAAERADSSAALPVDWGIPGGRKACTMQ